MSFEVLSAEPITVAFDQFSFSKAVQRREAKRTVAKHSSNSSTSSSSSSSSSGSHHSLFRKKDADRKAKESNSVAPKGHKEKKDSASSSESSTMKKRLLGKLFKILTLKVTESSPKPRTEDKKVYRRRSRSSQSSTPSNFEPMPTIFEENESDLISVQSFSLHQHQHHHKGPMIVSAMA